MGPERGPAVGGPESDSDSEPDCEPGPDSDELAESARDSVRFLARRAEAASPLRGISVRFGRSFQVQSLYPRGRGRPLPNLSVG